MSMVIHYWRVKASPHWYYRVLECENCYTLEKGQVLPGGTSKWSQISQSENLHGSPEDLINFQSSVRLSNLIATTNPTGTIGPVITLEQLDRLGTGKQGLNDFFQASTKCDPVILLRRIAVLPDEAGIGAVRNALGLEEL